MKITRRELRRIIMKEARLNEELSQKGKDRIKAAAMAPGVILSAPLAAGGLAAYLIGKKSGEALKPEVMDAWNSLDDRVKGPIEAMAEAMKKLPSGMRDTAIDGLVEMLKNLKTDGAS